jgi:dipeptidyl aminopeptidase/acylaminoacyl peptidase
MRLCSPLEVPMRRSISVALVLTILVPLAGCQRAGETTTAQDVPEYAIQQFLESTSVFGSSFSPDGSKILVSSDESGVFNAYAIPVDGGDMVQLTSSEDDAVLVAGYFRADERFLYSQDVGGNELNHLYVRELDGSVTDLTPGDSLKAMFLGWADDDQTFFVGTNQRDERFFDIYEVSPETYDRTLIYQDETGYELSAISPDKQLLVFSRPNTTNDNDLFLYDRATQEMRHLTPHEGDVAYSGQMFSPDGQSLYMTTDEGSEYSYLVRLDLATGDKEIVFQTDWDVWFAYLSHQDRYLVVGVNEDAQTVLSMFEYPHMEPVDLPSLPGLDVTSAGFSPDDDRIAFYASSSRSPRDLHVQELATGETTKLTSTMNPAIEESHLVDGEIVRFSSYDGVEIPGILYRPHEATPENLVPGLVWVHGGPGGQSRLGYSDLIQYLVNHGYAVYAINNRGSTGYGKTFYRMDDKKHGDADLDDCVASKTMLAETGWVDPERIGIVGGSYGGYMVLAALAFRPEEFAAGVDLFGISNWIRTLESIPPWWESFREALYTEMGHPETDRAMLEAKSPLFHSGNIVRPLMVLQGANDPRVIQPESDDIVEAVRANGVPVEYLVFDDEGHGFMKRENQEEGWEAILRFLDTHLKGSEVVDAP